jgi:hypothetical protein
MGSPSGLGSTRKDVLSKKEEFFRNLNLLATKRVKVKYCRTIKERLRQMQLQQAIGCTYGDSLVIFMFFFANYTRF